MVFPALLFMLASVVSAADNNSSQEDFFNMPLESLMDIEVYSASKHTQPASQAPSSVTVITQEEIKRYGYRNITDILNSVPGFYETYDRNYSYMGVRGFGRPGDFNSRILVLVDGQRLNDNIGNTALLGNESLIDADLIDRVEIVRGPGSALYGSNALFAVVSIFTKSGSQYNGGQIAGRFGSRRHTGGRFTYGSKTDNGIEFLASGTYADWEGDRLYYREFDDPSTNFGRTRNDDENLHNMLLKGSYRDFTFFAAGSRRQKGIPTASYETVFGAEDTRTWDDYTLIGLSYNHQIDEDFSILWRLSYHHYNYRGHYVYDDGGLYENKDWWKGRWITGEVQITKRFDDHHTLIVGAESQTNIRQDQKNWDFDVYLNDRRHSKNWGIYIQDEIRLTDRLTVNAGIRRDYYDQTGAQLNPRAAVIYQLTDTATVKLMAGRAFRAPSVYELYYQDNGNTAKANPNLQPETIKTYEAVFENRFSEKWRGTFSAFHYQVNDLIDQTIDPDDGLSQFRNLSQVTADGYEAALIGKWENGLQTRSSYASVRTLDKANRSSLANSPAHLVNFNLIYPLLENKLFAGLDIKYTSKRKTLSGGHTDDAVITNLTLTYDNILKNLDFQIGLYNLLDVNYEHPGFTEHLQDKIEQDGRTFGVKLTYRF